MDRIENPQITVAVGSFLEIEIASESDSFSNADSYLKFCLSLGKYIIGTIETNELYDIETKVAVQNKGGDSYRSLVLTGISEASDSISKISDPETVDINDSISKVDLIGPEDPFLGEFRPLQLDKETIDLAITTAEANNWGLEDYVSWCLYVGWHVYSAFNEGRSVYISNCNGGYNLLEADKGGF